MTSTATPRQNLSPDSVATAFDPATRSWRSAADTRTGLEKLPELDGVLLISTEALKEAADDFGHVVNRSPSAVLRPGSADDIARMIRFARKHRLKIGPRGQAHTMYGHAQVEAGIVIDMSSLGTIHALSEDRAELDAGVLWSTLVAQAVALGLTPPVLTDVLELSVGGTLAVGGVSGNSFRYGVQVDNVLELQVVTGEGEQLTCSPLQHRELFDMVLAGLGQCGLIVRATLRLIPAPMRVRSFGLSYADAGTMIQEQLRLIEEGRFDYVGGAILPASGGGWAYQTMVATYYSPPTQVDEAQLLAGLAGQTGAAGTDMTYLEWANRITQAMADLRSAGLFARPHPWCDLLVPASKLEAFLDGALKELTPAEITPQFPVLTYPFKRKHLTRPLFRVPEEDSFFLLDILRTASPETRGAAQMVAHNRQLFERNRAWGGTHYVISAIPCSPEDWKQHYGSAWDGFTAAKRRYDPDNVLTPGPGIFG